MARKGQTNRNNMSKLTFNQYLDQASEALGHMGRRRAVAVWALTRQASKQSTRALYGKTKYQRAGDYLVLCLTEAFADSINPTSTNPHRDKKRVVDWLARLSAMNYAQRRRLVQATVRDAVALGMLLETDDGWYSLAQFDKAGANVITPEPLPTSKMTTEGAGSYSDFVVGPTVNGVTETLALHS